MKKMSTLGWIAIVLLVIGGLNWGLVGAFGINIVDMIFGAGSLLARIVYILVGLAAIDILVEGAMKNKGGSAMQM